MTTDRIYISLFALGMAASLLSSCEQKALCFTHDSEYQLRAEAEYQLVWHENYDLYDDIDDPNLNWMYEWPVEFESNSEDLIPNEPEGLRAIFMQNDERVSTTNIDARGGKLSAPRGECSILFYNNDTEYIVFDDESSASTVKATTRTKTRASYKGNTAIGTKSENTVGAPDMLFAYYVESFEADRTQTEEVINVLMKPIVFTYVIHYEFEKGFEYVTLARGALSGMSGSAYIKDGTTTDEEVTILYDCELTSNGITANVNSFGIPEYTPDSGVLMNTYRLRSNSRKYGLNLEVKLKNGTIIVYDFDVTDQVSIQPNGGVITVSGIVISDEEGKKGGSGFNVDVEGWGEYQDIELPLGK